MCIRLTIRALVFAIFTSLAFTSFANECPEGKAAVTMTTPSGKTKTLCVSNSALPGLENAGEHSAANITPAVCPCFSFGEIEAILTNSTDIIRSESRFWEGNDGTPDACETAVLISFDGINAATLGAGTTTIDHNTGCITTAEIPTDAVSPIGCFKQYVSSFVNLTDILAEEGAACISILKQFMPE